ncbi:hypothetical protein BaRGS_00016347 [Batillaria attramentaria]|uniref:Uncharacterized protein n=1 Tax=Batillaria attramentaria TaxID=370345 RepID=A0ABD0L096_9CAEN
MRNKWAGQPALTRADIVMMDSFRESIQYYPQTPKAIPTRPRKVGGGGRCCGGAGRGTRPARGNIEVIQI